MESLYDNDFIVTILYLLMLAKIQKTEGQKFNKIAKTEGFETNKKCLTKLNVHENFCP